MSTYGHSAVLWTVILVRVLGCIGRADEIEVCLENDLASFVAKNEFVMVLYCTYFYIDVSLLYKYYFLVILLCG